MEYRTYLIEHANLTLQRFIDEDGERDDCYIIKAEPATPETTDLIYFTTPEGRPHCIACCVKRNEDDSVTVLLSIPWGVKILTTERIKNGYPEVFNWAEEREDQDD